MPLSRIVQSLREMREHLGTLPLVAAAVLIPIALVTGTALDYGMSFQVQQKLDQAAQSAAAAAVAQSRALRAIQPNVQPEEMMERGRGRADMVFNAQKPNVRNVKTSFRLERDLEPNTYIATFDYDAAQPTIFLRLLGIRDLNLHGNARATWVARDALIDEDFQEFETDVRASGLKTYAPMNGWLSNARLRSAGSAIIQLADASRYGEGKPENVTVAVELDVGVGNSFIAKKFSADPGLHQVRYWYREQVRNEMVAPAWFCSTREEDVSWMTTRDRSLAGNTSQLSVHLMPDNGRLPTSDMAFASGNRIDACYSSGGRWIERVIKVDIITRGDYWIAFHAQGKADGIGAAVANIVVCREPCAQDDGTQRPVVQNFPWVTDDLLFEDRFNTNEGPNPITLSPSRGKSGWDLAPAGWVVWPQNNITYKAGAENRPGFVELDVRTAAGAFENRAMGRSFFLVPGFYMLRYGYSSGASLVGSIACNYFSLDAALQRLPRVRGADTRRISVHVDLDFASLHPEIMGRGEDERADWFSPTRVSERDLKSDRLPRLPTLSNAIDFCADAPAGTIVPREIVFKVDRPGIYWVTFVGAGPADGEGGRISNVQLYARGANPGGGLPRVVRGYERNDPLAPPPVGAWLPMPPSAGGRAAYKVQLQ